jgi:hypothetical protein
VRDPDPGRSADGVGAGDSSAAPQDQLDEHTVLLPKPVDFDTFVSAMPTILSAAE